MEISKGDKVLVTLGGTYQEGACEFEVIKGSTGTVLEVYEPVKIPVHGYGMGFRVFQVRLDFIPRIGDEILRVTERKTSSFKIGDVIDIDIAHIQLLS